VCLMLHQWCVWARMEERQPPVQGGTEENLTNKTLHTASIGLGPKPRHPKNSGKELSHRPIDRVLWCLPSSFLLFQAPKSIPHTHPDTAESPAPLRGPSKAIPGLNATAGPIKGTLQRQTPLWSPKQQLQYNDMAMLEICGNSLLLVKDVIDPHFFFAFFLFHMQRMSSSLSFGALT